MIRYDFTGKVALVTGSSRGMGAAILEAFGTAGATWIYSFNAPLRSEGVVMEGDHPLVLEPGTSYRFAARFRASGSCQSGHLDRPSLNWMIYPEVG